MDVRDTPFINPGKNEVIEVGGRRYSRFAVQTHVITDADKLEDVITQYVTPHVQPDDIVVMSEKAVACTQSRAVRMADIHPRPLARFLCKFVQKTPWGIGLGIPETMEMALRECGVPRILFAAAISAVGKLFRQRGWFYHIAGERARAIDGPCDYTLPPYNEYVVLAPLAPDEMAKKIAAAAGCRAAVIDANDIGVKTLGGSDKSLDLEWVSAVFKDNPLGQASEQTPIGIIRAVSSDAV